MPPLSKPSPCVGIRTCSDYSPFGVELDGRTVSVEGYRFGFNTQEKTDEISGSGNHTTALYWEYDSRLGRRWNIDPVVKYHESSYASFANNPIWFLDPDGADTLQRANAIKKAKEYVAKKKPGNQYSMGEKNKPGGKVDCSGLVSNCITAGGEKDPNYGNQGSGVLNIENNLTSVAEKDLQVGNIISFRNTNGNYAYHIGIVTDFERDVSGNITSLSFIHSSGGIGPNEKEISTDEKFAWGKVEIHGYYKWDTKPDITKKTSSKTVQKNTDNKTKPSEKKYEKSWYDETSDWLYYQFELHFGL